MCGATSAQTNLEAQQAQFYQEMTSSYQQQFGAQSAILSALTASFQPILDAGINQEGFSPAEKQALETQSTEGVAQNYNKATQGLSENMAAAGGGNEFLPFGGQDQAKEELAASGAQESSNEQNIIQQEDYATGRANYMNAAGILGGVASQYNPVGYSGAATGAGSAAGNTANEIAQAGNAWMGALGG